MEDDYSDLIGQDKNNIRFLLNPNFDTSEVRMNAAENAVGGGVAGSGFASAGLGRMLDSERIQRFKLGNELLQPYIQRNFQTGERVAAQQHDLNRLATEGAQAMARLQLSEAGQTARLTQEERARLEQLAEQGRQAMQQLTLREAGETQRTRMNVAGNLASSLLSRARGGGGTTGGGFQPNAPSYRWTTDYNTGATIGGVAPPVNYYQPRAGGSGGYASTAAIDRILRQYNI